MYTVHGNFFFRNVKILHNIPDRFGEVVWWRRISTARRPGRRKTQNSSRNSNKTFGSIVSPGPAAFDEHLQRRATAILLFLLLYACIYYVTIVVAAAAAAVPATR